MRTTKVQTNRRLRGLKVHRAIWRSTVVAAIATFVMATTVLAAPARPNPAATESAACASLYSVPVNVGPDPLGSCQWDMRAIGATSTGSYAVNKGRGARVGVMDTGIDLLHPDIMPNVDLAASCVFLYSTTPTANPAEQVTRGDCSNKAALQDLAGHGTHTAGTIAAPINVSASPASRPRPRSWCSRQAPSRGTSSPSRSSMPCAMPAISGSTSST